MWYKVLIANGGGQVMQAWSEDRVLAMVERDGVVHSTIYELNQTLRRLAQGRKIRLECGGSLVGVHSAYALRTSGVPRIAPNAEKARVTPEDNAG